MLDKPTKIPQYSDEILRAVGLLFLMAAGVEQALGMMFSQLICHPRPIQGDSMLALQGTEVKIRLLQIQTIARHRVDKNVLPEIIDVCGKLRNAFDMRHDFAHNVSESDADPNRVTVTPFRSKNDGSLVNPKPYTVEQILTKAIRLGELSARLSRLLTKGGITPIPKQV